MGFNQRNKKNRKRIQQIGDSLTAEQVACLTSLASEAAFAATAKQRERRGLTIEEERWGLAILICYRTPELAKQILAACNMPPLAILEAP